MLIPDGFIIKWDEQLWRYFKQQHFISLLRTSKLYFASASQFSDEFEGSTHICQDSAPEHQTDIQRTYIDYAFSELKRLTKINCWHRSEYESDAMWRLYADEKKGVAITTTPERIRAALKPFRLHPEYETEKMYAGSVKYIDLTQDIGCYRGMLDRFFYKHRLFESEQEFRLAISLRLAEEFGVEVPSGGIHVDVDVNILIKNITIGPNTPPADRDTITEAITNAGLIDRIQKSTLTYLPRFT
ncbi:DUF2971 domain-containing protein [Desulfovibrio sp. TomC]|uniref:DUF2971 domain-containing protein n=1 Tax=Desulfovibrio sp. TomC TaxID=1562888 RepID=UPI0009E561E6|nr:DUF2971 domain-containing protein [Desulfovibrio sp. TomC]